jgi:hypothetical protein
MASVCRRGEPQTAYGACRCHYMQTAEIAGLTPRRGAVTQCARWQRSWRVGVRGVRASRNLWEWQADSPNVAEPFAASVWIIEQEAMWS